MQSAAKREKQSLYVAWREWLQQGIGVARGHYISFYLATESFTTAESIVNIDKTVAPLLLEAVKLNSRFSSARTRTRPLFRRTLADCHDLVLWQSSTLRALRAHRDPIIHPYRTFILSFYALSFFSSFQVTPHTSPQRPFTRFMAASLPQINSKNTSPIIAAAVIDTRPAIIPDGRIKSRWKGRRKRTTHWRTGGTNDRYINQPESRVCDFRFIKYLQNAWCTRHDRFISRFPWWLSHCAEGSLFSFAHAHSLYYELALRAFPHVCGFLQF